MIYDALVHFKRFKLLMVYATLKSNKYRNVTEENRYKILGIFIKHYNIYFLFFKNILSFKIRFFSILLNQSQLHIMF